MSETPEMDAMLDAAVTTAEEMQSKEMPVEADIVLEAGAQEEVVSLEALLAEIPELEAITTAA